jgi:hypothetical protein
MQMILSDRIWLYNRVDLHVISLVLRLLKKSLVKLFLNADTYILYDYRLLIIK